MNNVEKFTKAFLELAAFETNIQQVVAYDSSKLQQLLSSSPDQTVYVGLKGDTVAFTTHDTKLGLEIAAALKEKAEELVDGIKPLHEWEIMWRTESIGMIPSLHADKLSENFAVNVPEGQEPEGIKTLVKYHLEMFRLAETLTLARYAAILERIGKIVRQLGKDSILHEGRLFSAEGKVSEFRSVFVS